MLRSALVLLLLQFLLCAGAGSSHAATPPVGSNETGRAVVAAVEAPRSEMAAVVVRFAADRGALQRKFPILGSRERLARLDLLLEEWSDALEALDVETLSDDALLEWHLLRTLIARDRYRLAEERRDRDAATSLVPLLSPLSDLVVQRAALPPPDPAAVAASLDRIASDAKETEVRLRARLALSAEDPDRPSPAQCRLAWKATTQLTEDLRIYVGFRDGYDPLFTWWTARPAAAAMSALGRLATTLREQGMGVTAETPNAIVGTPIGAEALADELLLEWVPYSATELIEIADREFAWCMAELSEAAREMGFDDWRDALEETKRDHVAPGEQPALVAELAGEAIAFLRERDLVTVPANAEESWRMTMMTPERQLVTPFFTGGEVVSVSFPTAGMEHGDKVMSLRGNNRAFSRAVVHHELIPGHHLQQWSEARFRTHRRPFATPFWTEGWALHWEMLLWDRGFARTPQERIGMLWWRAHRAARIQFSLRFHLGEWSAEECVEHLVDQLAHERANAEGEVRRSFSGDYPPLYQIAYMVGGLQMRALHHELVGSGAMTDRDFHDEVLRQGNIPIEPLRTILRGERLPRDARPSWRFDDALPPNS